MQIRAGAELLQKVRLPQRRRAVPATAPAQRGLEPGTRQLVLPARTAARPGRTPPELRRGGYPSRRAAQAARAHARTLLDLATGDPTATDEVAGLIQATGHRQPLPPVEAVRHRLEARRALAGSTTIAVYQQRWLALRPVDENTRRTYASLIQAHLTPHLGHLPLNRLRLDDIRAMFNAIEAANEQVRAARRSTSLAARESARGRRVTGLTTCHRIRSALRVALNDAVAEGLIPTNPATAATLRPARPARPLVWTPPRVDRWQDTGEVPGPVMLWTPEQTGAFLDHVARHDPHLYPLFHLIAHRGLRRGEAIGLRDADTQLDRAEIATPSRSPPPAARCSASLPRAPPTNGPSPSTPAPSRSCAPTAPIDRPPATVRCSSSARTGKHGTRPRSAAASRRLVADAALPPVRLHDLRHGAAALAAGVDLKVIQATLGHSTMMMTANTYTSVLPQLAQAAAEAVAATRQGLQERPAPSSAGCDAQLTGVVWRAGPSVAHAVGTRRGSADRGDRSPKSPSGWLACQPPG